MKYGNLAQVSFIKPTGSNASDQYINLAQVNARSVAGKCNTLYEFILDNNVDILAISETWLRDGDDPIVHDL